MKLRCVLCFVLAGMLAGLVLVARADEKDKSKEPVTIKGEVVDLSCWLADEKKGADHVKCAKSCIQNGAAAGIVTDDGVVYLVVVHQKEGRVALEHIGETMEFTGTVTERGGMKGILVKSCKKVEAGKDGKDGKDGKEGSDGSHK